MQIAQKIKIDTNIHACVKAVLGLSFKSATDKHALKKENPPRIPQRFLDFYVTVGSSYSFIQQ